MENNLPDNWAEADLSFLVDYKKGKKPKRMEKSPFKNSLVYLDIRAIEKGVDENFVDQETSNATTEEELVVVWDGARAGWVGKSRKGALGSTLMSLRPKIDKDYLFRFLQTQFDHLQSNHRGTGIPHVDPDIFWNIKVPVAPSAEQRRVVAKLDELMQKIDHSRARMDHVSEILRRFRRSVLAAAVNGKLTKEWREKNGNIKSVDLTEIDTEREKLQRARAKERGQNSFKYSKPVEIEMGERSKGVDELFEIPETWKWTSLDNAVWSVSDGPHFSPKYVSQKEGIAFISSRNVSYKTIDFSDAKYVSKSDHLEFIKRGKPQVGDLLLTKGGTTGIAHVVDTSVDFSIWVHVALLKVIKKYVEPKYLRDVLTTDFLYRQSQAQTHGVGNQDLGLTRMIYMTIPLPPKEEQIEIVRKIEQYFLLADKIEARYNKAKTQLDKLPQSLIVKAFRGELAAQDPNDESASLLLARINRERELTAKTKRMKPREYFMDETPLKVAAEKKSNYKKAVLNS